MVMASFLSSVLEYEGKVKSSWPGPRETQEKRSLGHGQKLMSPLD